MALTDGNVVTTMPVAPAYAGYGNNGGFGNSFGGDWGWIILLLLLAGGNGFGGGFGFGGGELYPWINNSQNINDGFREQMLNSNVTSIRDGIAALSTQLCNCCGDMQMAVSNGFAQAEIAANSRQMADMNQNFAMQTAMSNGFNATQAQLAQCCCDNRLASADLKYTIATENCADRAALSDGIRDILAATQAQTQTILDKMCADKIDAKNDEISQLRQELLYARGQASQIAQNSTIVDSIYNRLDTCPVGTTPVYGRTPIFTCNNNGCGCGNF
jgi:hypothetical protein